MKPRNLAVTGVLLFLPMCLAVAGPVNQLVVFGDSLSDNGNAAAALIAAGQPSLASMNYAPNAFTDGPNTMPATTGPFGLWIDQFAAKVGAPDPQPFFAAGGTNYAFAGTNTAPGNNPSVLDAFDISNQVTAFSLSHLGNAPSDALYTIWGGANDIFNGVNGGSTAADNLAGSIKTLAAEGAKNFLWLNLPNLGETPRGALQGPAALTAQTLAFNTEWAIDLLALQSQGINVIGVDINSLFNQIMNNPMNFGFADVTHTAQCTTAVGCATATVDPNTFLFWDPEHPTTAGDALVADTAFADFNAVPEPLSAGLSVLGLMAVLAALKLRRKQAAV